MILIGGQRSRTACASFSPSCAAGHVDVGEQQSNVRAGFQNGHGFVGIVCQERRKSGSLDDISREQLQN